MGRKRYLQVLVPLCHQFELHPFALESSIILVRRRAMNKTRRRRVTTSDNTAGASVYELYEIHGDAASALAACPTVRGGVQKGGGKGTEDYNRVLLSYMASEKIGRDNATKIIKQMEEWEIKFGEKEAFPMLKARKRTRNEWIAAYNRALLLLANGDVERSIHVCSEKLRTMVTGRKKASSEMSMVRRKIMDRKMIFMMGLRMKAPP